jgi:hypothetical protein
MISTHKDGGLHKYCILAVMLFFSWQLKAQNCTVNAGLDGSACYNGVNNSYAYDILSLNGNSAGNISANANLLWEIVSAPIGAIVSFVTPNSNATIVQAVPNQLPTGTYVFRLGVNCQTGGRVYDSVTYNITNVSDGFALRADKLWSDMCAGSQDSMKLVGRPLRAGEILKINGRSIWIAYGNAVFYPGADFYGPTTDSVRFTIRSTLANDCAASYWPFVNYNIRVGGCQSFTFVPQANGIAVDVALPKATFFKTGFRTNTDTLKCITSGYVHSLTATNICVKGGRANTTNVISTRVISGSGNCSTGYFGSSFVYYVQNKWDTVTQNTLHLYEVTYNSNGCFQTFKDTIRIFFKYVAPSNNGVLATSSKSFCFEASSFPLSSTYGVLNVSNPSAISPSHKFSSTLYAPFGSNAAIINPLSQDTIKIAGHIIPGVYSISTVIVDTVTGCNAASALTQVALSKKAVLPVLRDTSFCGIGYLDIPYSGKLPNANEYYFTIVNGPSNNLIHVISINSDSTIRLDLHYPSYTPAGKYTISLSPYVNAYSCNDNRSDTFELTIFSQGRVSNAGTDQMLLCNTANTNLAGSLPSASGGSAGFWKFLPAISSNGANPPVIADSTNRNTLVSGFSNLSSNYFSWNVTTGNTSSYCNLLPDTVLVVFSGVPPSVPQQAQANYVGALPPNGTYLLTSNAVTPTFNVQWNKLSGLGGTIVSPNSQNTNVTGLTASTYVFELVVSNSCGEFKDTVTLNFPISSLPVKLLGFNGYRKSESTDLLTWQVAEEIDMSFYEVQISENGFDFKAVGTVAISNISSNNKIYEFTNSTLLRASNFYRIKMVNIDGTFAFSNILKLSNKQKNINSLEVMPNPARTFVSAHINSNKAYSTQIELVNILGQVVLRRNIQIKKGVNTIPVDVTSLSRGILFVKVDEMVTKLVLE